MDDGAHIDEQELRVAVVMNGGVSLAVWMGGVTRELDRLRRCDGAYAELARLVRTVPRVDVIAGSSAGGINGAVLAVAIARGSHVGRIRDIWMEEGSIGDLLRDPLERGAPSLFHGDRRLLTALGAALQAVAADGASTAAAEHPLHLTVTGTMLQAEVKTYADHFGAVVPDVDHRARFVFRRGEVGEVPDDGQAWPDTFAGAGALAQIALAARSSASFPVAFEPSFCPVGAAGSDAAHPDMAGRASFRESRWVIDGGVLVNTPFRPALDAIATLPAERSVRRVLAYVVPHPFARAAQADTADTLPRALDVAIGAGSRLPRVQSIGRELEEIAANNRRVAKRRESRLCTLDDLRPDELETAAQALLRAYVCVRREAAVTDIVDLLLEGRRGHLGEPSRGDAGRPPLLNVPSLAQVEGVRRALRATEDTPWLPAAETTIRDSVEEWRWGLAPIEQAANLTLDVLRMTVELVGSSPRRDAAMDLRARFHEQLASLRRALRRNRTYWRSRHFLLDDPRAVDEAVRGWAPLAREAEPIAHQLARILHDAGELLDGLSDGTEPAEGLRRRLRTLNDSADGAPRTPALTLRRVLSLEVVQRASGADLAGIEQMIELVLMSANAANAFDARTRPEEKLAGLQVAHFGSFYKKSWRANDWMWGRLDGADRTARMVLDPRRVARRLADEPDTDAESLLAEIRAIAAPSAAEPGSSLDGPGLAWLGDRWDEQEGDLRAELAALGPSPLPTDLRVAHAAVRRRLQLEILCEEIGGVRDAARADVAAGAARDATGARWQAGLSDGTLDGTAAISAFQTCDIGAEKLVAEGGSDHFTSVVTRALGVTGSVAGGAVSWKPLRPVLNTVRGVLLSVYLLGRGVVAGSRTGNFLVALVLAVGGALVALSLLGVEVPGLLTLLGATLLGAGVLLGQIRRTAARIVAVLLLYVATVAAYYGVQQWDDRPAWIDAVAVTAAIVLLASGATLLGYRARRGPLPRGRGAP